MRAFRAESSFPPCPRCGGRLSEPISGDVHCYRECRACGARFELGDPEMTGTRTGSGGA